MNRVSSVVSACIVSGITLLGSAEAQTTWFVDASAVPPGNGTPTSPYVLIQDALDAPATLDGDTIQVAPGTYAELVDFGSKSVVLQSEAGAAQTTIDATGLFALEQSVVRIRAGQGPSCVLAGFTLRGGEGSSIAGGPFDGKFVGGGLLVRGASPTVRDCELTQNDATCGAGAYVENGNPTFERCSFTSNTMSIFAGGGAMLTVDSDVTLSECTIADHTNQAFAAGILVMGGRIDATDCVFAHNLATEGGHVVLGAFGSVADSSLTRTTFTSGSSSDGHGGAIQVVGGTHTWVDCTFGQNVSANDHDGGAAYFENAVVTITGSSFTGNRSGRGGALMLRSSTATIASCTFTSNRVQPALAYAFREGGALFVQSSTVAVAACTFTDNEAFHDVFLTNPSRTAGGAVCCIGAGVTIDDSRFVGNRARAKLASVGSAGLNPLPACTGGAVFGPAVIRRCTFWGNSAKTDTTSGQGYCVGGTLAQVTSAEHCTIYDSQIQGVGPLPDAAPVMEGGALSSSIAREYLPLQLPPLGATTVATYSNVQGGPAGTGMIDADPMFWNALMGDLHLRPGSPSQDTGDPAGAPDPDGSLPDQGAFAFDPAYAPPSVQSYCLPRASSAGCAALLTTSDPDTGPISGQMDYLVRAQGVLGGKVGLFLQSLSGPANVPALGGTLCLASPLFRVAPQTSGGSSSTACDGALELVVNTGVAPLDPGPGGEIWLQAWYRDPLNGAGALGSALSNAVGLVFQ
jgi:hypothetical protein